MLRPRTFEDKIFSICFPFSTMGSNTSLDFENQLTRISSHLKPTSDILLHFPLHMLDETGVEGPIH